jgi:hypothetical protein
MIEDGEDGSRVVRLYIPFEFNKKRVDRIAIKAVQLDHVLRWQAGEFRGALPLLASLTGLQEMCLRQLRYPDADRVLTAFFQMLPPEIANQVAAGEVPLPVQRGEEGWGEPVPAPSPAPQEAASPPPADDAGGLDIGDH